MICIIVLFSFLICNYQELSAFTLIDNGNANQGLGFLAPIAPNPCTTLRKGIEGKKAGKVVIPMQPLIQFDDILYRLIIKTWDGAIIKENIIIKNNLKKETLICTIPIAYFPVSFNDSCVFIIPKTFSNTDTCLITYDIKRKFLNKDCLVPLNSITEFGKAIPVKISMYNNKVFYKSFNFFQGYGSYFQFYHNQDTHLFSMVSPEFISRNVIITRNLNDLSLTNKDYLYHNFDNKKMVFLSNFVNLIPVNNSDSLFAIRFNRDSSIYELGVITLDCQIRGFDRIGEIIPPNSKIIELGGIKSVCITLQSTNTLDFELLHCCSNYNLYYRIFENGINIGIYRLNIKENVISKISNSIFDNIIVNSEGNKLLGFRTNQERESISLYIIELD